MDAVWRKRTRESSLRSCVRIAAVFGAWSLYAWGPSALAQDGNHNDLLIGGRAAAMGGAFTAVADDASAAIHNPAGLAQISRQSISASISAYGVASTTAEGVYVDDPNSADLKRTDIQIFPGTTGYVFPLPGGESWSHTLAATILVTDFSEFEGAVDLSSDALGIIAQFFDKTATTTLYVGPSYGFRFKQLYVGASAFLQYSQNQNRTYSAGNLEGDGAVLRFSDFETLDSRFFGLVGVLGALYQINKHWAVGAAMELPNIRLGGSATSFFASAESIVDVGVSDPLDPSLYQTDPTRSESRRWKTRWSSVRSSRC